MMRKFKKRYNYNLNNYNNTYNYNYNFSRNVDMFKDMGEEPAVWDIEEMTKKNRNYRTTIWTGKYMQITLMSIEPGENIGLELHEDTEQFIRIEEGEGIIQMGDSQDNLNFRRNVSADDAFIVPSGVWHDLVNTGREPIKLYSIYAPPHHLKGTIDKTKPEE